MRTRLFSLALAATLSAAIGGCSETATPAIGLDVGSVGSADLIGDYVNERGSRLHITAVDQGLVRGTFQSGVGASTSTHPVVGVANGDVVAFSVSFGSAGSATSWAGQLDGDRLVTQWHLSRDVEDADEAQKLWSSVMSGSDVFTKQ